MHYFAIATAYAAMTKSAKDARRDRTLGPPNFRAGPARHDHGLAAFYACPA